MNLTNMLRRDAAVEDHSLVDHSWVETGLSRKDGPILDIESMKNPNNVKPQLEVEWGLGGGDIDLDEPAGIVQRNIPEDDNDANSVILFARDMMNRGARGRQVAAALRGKYPQPLLAKAQKGLRAMFALEGLVGRIMVDARGYRNCQAAVKSASLSPYKRFIKYVYGCSCGDPHTIPIREHGVIGSVAAGTGNATDDFFASDHSASVSVPHCRSTMMPILSSRGDLDPSLMDGTLVEMMNLTPLPESVADQIRAMKCSDMAKIRAAFRWIDKQADSAEDAKYAGRVDASEFQLRRADNEIDLSGLPLAELPVDEKPGDIELDELFDAPQIDVDLVQFQEPEFEGSDEVTLDPTKSAPADLAVEMVHGINEQDIEL